MHPEPVPDTARLAAVPLLSQFSPKLADVAAALKQALIQIISIGVDRVWVPTRRPFREYASLYPSLHRAETDIDLASGVGLAHATFNQVFHPLIEAVPPLAVLLFRCYGWDDRDLKGSGANSESLAVAGQENERWLCGKDSIPGYRRSVAFALELIQRELSFIDAA